MPLGRLLSILFIATFSAALVAAQEKHPEIVWNLGPGCGALNANAETKSLICEVSHKHYSPTLIFRNRDLTFSMTYWLSKDDLRVAVLIENSGQDSVPIDMKRWNLRGYRSLDDFDIGKPVFTSRAKAPFRVGELLSMSRSGLPSNAPLSREVTTEPTTDPSAGQIVNKNTTVIKPNPSAPPPSSSPTISAGQVQATSPLKWKEVPSGTKLEGVVSFGVDDDAAYFVVSFDISRTTYIYKLLRPER